MKATIAVMICIIAITVVLAQAPTSVAAERNDLVAVTGTLTLAGYVEAPSIKTADGNTFIALHTTWNVAGDFLGTFDCHPRATLFSTYESFVSEHGTYTVTWGEYEGTINVRNVGWLGDDGLYHLDTTIVGGGTGDLAKLRGHGSTVLNFGANTMTYSFEVFWA